MPIYNQILKAKTEHRTLFAVLIDPEKCFGQKLVDFVKIINAALPHYLWFLLPFCL